MKKIVKVLSLIVAPFVAICAFLTGCKSCKGKPVQGPERSDFMRDIDEEPTQDAYYEAQSRQALKDYQDVAALHLDDEGEVDMTNEEVVAAANSAAAKLFAYACYNERYLDRFVYFGNQRGTTDLGSFGRGTADRQEYFLRINESEDTCGYRFHSTIKKVYDSSGTMDTFKSLFETARVRMTDKTNLLYRFEGNSIKYGEYNEYLGCDVLTCEWRTGENWGTPDVQMVKGSELNSLEEIEADIQAMASDSNRNIHGNINILAENIVKFANISVDEDDGCINVLMTIDTDVANNDEASMTMLRTSNGTDGNCNWISDPETAEEVGFAEDTGLRIVFRLWSNGLFRMYNVIERWRGKMDLTVAKPMGEADSQTLVYYSYSDHDCDMTAYLDMLAAANDKLEG